MFIGVLYCTLEPLLRGHPNGSVASFYNWPTPVTSGNKG